MVIWLAKSASLVEIELTNLPILGGQYPPIPPFSDTPVSVPTVLNDPAKVEGVQSFPHLEAQHGAAKTWPPISTCLDIIFQRRSVGLGSLCVSR